MPYRFQIFKARNSKITIKINSECGLSLLNPTVFPIYSTVDVLLCFVRHALNYQCQNNMNADFHLFSNCCYLHPAAYLGRCMSKMSYSFFSSEGKRRPNKMKAPFPLMLRIFLIPEITANLPEPCSSLAILSASSINIIPNPYKCTRRKRTY